MWDKIAIPECFGGRNSLSAKTEENSEAKTTKRDVAVLT